LHQEGKVLAISLFDGTHTYRGSFLLLLAGRPFGAHIRSQFSQKRLQGAPNVRSS